MVTQPDCKVNEVEAPEAAEVVRNPVALCRTCAGWHHMCDKCRSSYLLLGREEKATIRAKRKAFSEYLFTELAARRKAREESAEGIAAAARLKEEQRKAQDAALFEARRARHLASPAGLAEAEAKLPCPKCGVALFRCKECLAEFERTAHARAEEARKRAEDAEAWRASPEGIAAAARWKEEQARHNAHWSPIFAARRAAYLASPAGIKATEIGMREAAGLCSPKQSAVLQRAGLQFENVSKRLASQAIATLAVNGYKPTGWILDCDKLMNPEYVAPWQVP